MATMNTYTGNKIDPMNMTASDISIQDIFLFCGTALHQLYE